jgi:hypothetical protein
MMSRFITIQALKKAFEAKNTKVLPTLKRSRFNAMKAQVLVLSSMVDAQTEVNKVLFSEMIETIIKSNFNEYFKIIMDLKRSNENKVSTEFYNHFFSKCDELIRLEEESLKSCSTEAKKGISNVLDKVVKTLRTKITDSIDCELIIEIFSKRRSVDEKKKLLNYIKAFSIKSINREVG